MANAWLMLAKGDNRQHAGNLGYEDEPSSHYIWDSTVANHGHPKIGDGIVLWDGSTLLGASVIRGLIRSPSTKLRLRCPKCGSTKIKKRKSRTAYKCHDQTCKVAFDEPKEEEIEVTAYQTDHQAGWVEMHGNLDRETLRNLCFQPKSQHSIRPFDWDSFLRISDQFERYNLQLASEQNTDDGLEEGHRPIQTRIRVGQANFRSILLKKFGSNCALSGSSPVQTLDAAHLYSYANHGKHYDGGGLLLRRDLHRLFDLGLLAIDPENLEIDVTRQIRDFPQYGILHGTPLKVGVSGKEKKWIKIHWDNYRVSLSARTSHPL